MGPYRITQTGTLDAGRLTEVREAAKTLYHSGLLQPHEKQHLWEIIVRIDGTRQTLDADHVNDA